MPKRKRATALFEVMAHAAPPEPLVKSRSLFQSPSLWSIFKPKKPVWPAVTHEAVAEPVAHHREPMPHRREEMPVQVEYESVGVLEQEASHPQPERPPREPWFNFDRFKFEWDVMNSVIAASAVVIVVGLGVMIEHKFRHVPVPTMAAVTTADLKKQPAHPDVMNIPRRSTQAPQNADPFGPANPPVDDNPPKTTVAPPISTQRTINMNYVVIQSFPDAKAAQDCVDALTKSGVPCTAIQGLKNWAPNPRWYTVLGLKPFGPRMTGTTEFETYVQKIRDAGNTFAGKSKWYKPTPQLYRWTADSEK